MWNSLPEACNRKEKPNDGACRIEKIPQNGWIEYAIASRDRLPLGQYVNSITTVNYKCKENHIIEDEEQTYYFCLRGNWQNPVADCVPRCSADAFNGNSFIATKCSLNNFEISCSNPAKPGTIANISCIDQSERQQANAE